MTSPRFLDSVQTVSFGGQRQAAGAAIALQSGGDQSGFNFGKNRPGDLVRHYSYWNFVAISRIADRVSTVRPNIGYTASLMPSAGLQQRVPSYLTQSQRSHLTRFYGSVVQSHEDLKPVPDGHPLTQLLRTVNPVQTWQQLVEESFNFLLLTGEFYWWIIPNRIRMSSGAFQPAEIYCVPPQWITNVIKNEDGSVKAYVLTPNGSRSGQQTIPVEEMLRFVRHNPMNPGCGFSPIEAAPFWTTNAEQVEASRYAAFKNGVNPDLIVTLEDNADPGDVGTIKEKLMQRAAGYLHNREPLVVPPGIKNVVPWSNKPKEMDYAESADQVRDQGLALHGVPKVIAGITTDVNRATVEGANVVFCENVLNPALAKFAGFLTERLASLYDPRIVLWYDDCTPKNSEMELKETQLDFQMGAITPDERRVDRGRQPMGEIGYESGYIGSSMVPLSDDIKEENQAKAEAIAAGNGPGADGEDPPGDTGVDSTDSTDNQDSQDSADNQDSTDAKDAKPKKKSGKSKQAVPVGSGVPSLDGLI